MVTSGSLKILFGQDLLQEFPPARVEPTIDEMAAFWEKCL